MLSFAKLLEYLKMIVSGVKQSLPTAWKNFPFKNESPPRRLTG